MDKTVIHNNKSTLTIIEDNILHIYYEANSELEIADVIEVEKAYEQLPEPKPLKVVSEIGPFVTMSADARAYAAERSPDLVAIAYVIKSLSQRMLLKFYVRMWKRKKPSKVFEDYQEALKWLKSI